MGMSQISIKGDDRNFRNAEITVDGQAIRCVTELCLRMDADNFPEVEMTLLGRPHVETLATLNINDDVTNLLERVLDTLHNNGLAGVIDLNRLITEVKSKMPPKTEI